MIAIVTTMLLLQLLLANDGYDDSKDNNGND